jgi:ABC-type oligopeptide transport system substrate-binding subunit
LKSTYEDIESITAEPDNEVQFHLRRPLPFIAESLVDFPIQKPGTPAIGTGPFVEAPRESSASAIQLSANRRYYLSSPGIDRIDVRTYPNGRAAWADLLRDQVDMLYEVGSDVIDITGNSQVALYEFERQLQYMVVLNTNIPKLRAREVRRALNQAIDRKAIVRDALRQHAVPSAGPISPHHWARARPVEIPARP